MKYLLLLPFLFLSVSFKSSEVKDEFWIGTMQVYQNSNNQFIIYYRGNVHYCMTKYIIDALYTECDTQTVMKSTFDKFFPGLHKIPLEEYCPEEDSLKIEHL